MFVCKNRAYSSRERGGVECNEFTKFLLTFYQWIKGLFGWGCTEHVCTREMLRTLIRDFKWTFIKFSTAFTILNTIFIIMILLIQLAFKQLLHNLIDSIISQASFQGTLKLHSVWNIQCTRNCTNEMNCVKETSKRWMKFEWKSPLCQGYDEIRFSITIKK